MLREFLAPWDVQGFGLRRKRMGEDNGPGVNAFWLQNPALGYETCCTCAATAKCTLILSSVLFASFPSILNTRLAYCEA